MTLKHSIMAAFFALLSSSVMASELNLNLQEEMVKEEVARELGVHPDSISVAPTAIEYAKSNDSKEGVHLKGRVFITWTAKNNMSVDSDAKYTTNGVTLSSKTGSLDGSTEGAFAGSVKLGYQMFEHLGIEASYEKSRSVMEVTSIGSGLPVGSVSSLGRISNEFQTVKIGLQTNVPLVKAKSFRLDMVGGVNGGMIIVDSTYKNKGDVYSGAIGYSVGAEAGVRLIHKSGVYLQTGVGMNNKTLAPKTYKDGSSSSFNSSEKYVYISVGITWGGEKR